MEAVIRKQTSFRLREDLLQILQEQAKKANRSLRREHLDGRCILRAKRGNDSGYKGSTYDQE